MSANVVYFAHGKESGPWGTKIQALAEVARAKGCHVESPDYSSIMDPDKRVQKLLSLEPFARNHLIFVGSSMGGYVSAVASENLSLGGLFLLAPAIFCQGYAVQNPKPYAQRSVVIHGWDDEIIPVEHSIRYAKEHKITLHILKGDHRLVNALPEIEILFASFLDQVLAP